MFIFLVVVWIVQIVLFVLSIKKNHGNFWLTLILSEAASIVASTCLQVYFNNLPPNDSLMPGLSYLGDIIFAGALGIVSIVNLVVTIIVSVLIKRNPNV